MSIWNELLPSILFLKALNVPSPLPPTSRKNPNNKNKYLATMKPPQAKPPAVVTSKWSKLPTKPPKGRKPTSNLPPGSGLAHSDQSSSFVKPSLTLTITIAIGCSLLIVNVLIFAGAYRRKEKTSGQVRSGDAKHSGQCSDDDEEDSSEDASCSSLYHHQHHQHLQNHHHNQQQHTLQQDHAVRCTCNTTLLQPNVDITNTPGNTVV